MCKWFSCIVTKEGDLYYSTVEHRDEILKAKHEAISAADQHSVLAHEAGVDIDDVDGYEFDPWTGQLCLDEPHLTRDLWYSERAYFGLARVQEVVESIPLKDMLPSSIDIDMAKYRRWFEAGTRVRICDITKQDRKDAFLLNSADNLYANIGPARPYFAEIAMCHGRALLDRNWATKRLSKLAQAELRLAEHGLHMSRHCGFMAFGAYRCVAAT